MYIVTQSNINIDTLIPEGTVSILGKYDNFKEAEVSVIKFVTKGIEDGFEGNVERTTEEAWTITSKEYKRRTYIEIVNLDFVKNWDEK